SARDLSFIRRTRPVSGLILMLSIAAPWFVAMAFKHHDFLWFYFVHEHVLRFLGARWPKDAEMPSALFLGKALGLLFPWFVFLPQAARRALRGGDGAGSLLSLGVATVLGFFALSVNKQDTYAILVFPATAVVIARWWTAAPGPLSALCPSVFAVAGIVALL